MPDWRYHLEATISSRLGHRKELVEHAMAEAERVVEGDWNRWEEAWEYVRFHAPHWLSSQCCPIAVNLAIRGRTAALGQYDGEDW